MNQPEPLRDVALERLRDSGLKLLNTGGTINNGEGKISIAGADQAVIFITAATDYERFTKLSRRNVAAAAAKDLQAGKPDSVAKYKEAVNCKACHSVHKPD